MHLFLRRRNRHGTHFRGSDAGGTNDTERLSVFAQRVDGKLSMGGVGDE